VAVRKSPDAVALRRLGVVLAIRSGGDPLRLSELGIETGGSFPSGFWTTLGSRDSRSRRTPSKTSHMEALLDLPLLTAMEEPNWGSDLDAQIAAIFARGEGPVRRNRAGAPIVVGKRAIRRLAAARELGNLPAVFLGKRLRHLTGPGQGGFQELMANHIFSTNPPLHGPLRQALSRHFAKGKTKELRGIAEAAVASAYKETAGRGEIDFERDFARFVTAGFWARLFDLSPAEGIEASTVAGDVLPAINLQRTDEEGVAANLASFRYLEALAEALDREVEAGGNPVLAEMEASFREIDAEGRPSSLGAALGAMLFDGFHTANVLLTNTMYSLLRHPAVLAMLRDDEDRVPAAVDECFRLHPAVFSTTRLALAEVEYEGLVIPAGTPVRMLWLAGNRDPEVYEAPTEFRFDRPVFSQTTFGGGFHICVGRHVAKLLAEAMVRPLAHSSFAVEEGEGASWIMESTSHQLHQLPVAIHHA
jgi:cytochrome P450